MLPKQPETLIKELERHGKILPGELMADPFVVELVFCCNLHSKVLPPQIRGSSSNLSGAFNNAISLLANFTQECPLIKKSLIQYRLLKGEFASIEKEYTNPLKVIEVCFQVANAYWNIIKNYLTTDSFQRSEHETYFFKVIKPSFTSECDFLSLAYHALLFSRATDKDAKFWEREKQRKEKLLEEHPDFFSRYLTGNTDNDEIWFTRTMKVDYCSHDYIVSSWFAIRRYETFIEKEILNLNN